jgi:hypothetical protein
LRIAAALTHSCAASNACLKNNRRYRSLREPRPGMK